MVCLLEAALTVRSIPIGDLAGRMFSPAGTEHCADVRLRWQRSKQPHVTVSSIAFFHAGTGPTECGSVAVTYPTLIRVCSAHSTAVIVTAVPAGPYGAQGGISKP